MHRSMMIWSMNSWWLPSKRMERKSLSRWCLWMLISCQKIVGRNKVLLLLKWPFEYWVTVCLATKLDEVYFKPSSWVDPVRKKRIGLSLWTCLTWSTTTVSDMSMKLTCHLNGQYVDCWKLECRKGQSSCLSILWDCWDSMELGCSWDAEMKELSN